jgi:hypothetical protein
MKDKTLTPAEALRALADGETLEGNDNTLFWPTRAMAYHCNSCDTDFTVLIHREGGNDQL